MSESPPCRICGKTKYVAIYSDEAPEQTVCMECCDKAEHADGETGHQFDYEPGEGLMCRYCGIRRSDTNYEYDYDE